MRRTTRRPLSSRVVLLLLIATLAAPLAGAPVQVARAATTLFVAPEGRDDANDCRSPENPCGTIDRATRVAGDGDTIQIATGIYTETLLIHKELTLKGAGTEATIIDGGGESRVVQVNDATATIADLTIRNGSVSGNGAGIFNNGALTLNRVVVSANQASGAGGGIYNNGVLILNSSAVQENGADRGGGIFNNGGDNSLTLTDSAISNNSARFGGGISNGDELTITGGSIAGNTADADGGAIWMGGGSLSMTGGAFNGNSAGRGGAIFSGATQPVVLVDASIEGNQAGFGGAIFNLGPNLILRGGLLSENLARGDEKSQGQGGAIYNDGELQVEETGFFSNSILADFDSFAGAGGAIFNDSGGALKLTGATFTNNSARSGGGIANRSDLTIVTSTFNGQTAVDGAAIESDGLLSIVNSTISGNTARSSGGGLRVSGGPALVTNSTIAGNRAPGFEAEGQGGGIMLVEGSLALKNTLLANNIDGRGDTGDCVGAIDDGGNNMASDETCNFSASGSRNGVDPRLGPLQGNGGPTLTHALEPDSPAIDAGADKGCPATDQRSVPRPQGPRCDIGAFEREFEGPRTLFVALEGNDANNCLSAEFPCRTIGAAIDKAVDGDTIRIAAGTYSENLVVSEALTLAGADAETTIVDGSDEGRVLRVTEGVSATIADLTIQNGSASNGGGIFNAGTLTIDDSAIRGNSAFNGGGIYNAGSLTLTGSTIANNGVGDIGDGGGVYNAGVMRLADTLVADNRADFGRGAGIYNRGTLVIARATISGGSVIGESEGSGGGIGNSGVLTVTESVIRQNEADWGGGVYSDAGVVTIANSTISDNQGSNGSGGGVFNRGTLTLINTTVIGNEDVDIDNTLGGGGIGNEGTLTLIGSFVRDNIAQTRGGGIANGADGRVRLSNTSVISNIVLSDDSAAVLRGGGIYNAGALQVDGGAVDNNVASIAGASLGGGIYNDGALAVRDATVNGNTANDGGGIGNSGSARVEITTIVSNTAATGNGGGIDLAEGSQFALIDTQIQGNSAAGDGGGLYNQGGVVELAGSTVADNRSDDEGGGVANFGTLRVDTSTFSNNSAGTEALDDSGGAIFNNGALDISTSTFVSNRSSFGGGVSNRNGALNITNSTFSGNAATVLQGGGLFVTQGTAILNSVTFVGNTGVGGGGGIFVLSSPLSPTATLVNSIVDTCGGPITDGGNNLASDASCPVNSPGGEPADPRLGPLQDNGGPTPTHALLEGSPAIDAGADEGCPATDQRGFPRPQGSRCDIGAFELPARGPGNLFVAPDGDDANNCLSVAAACRTIDAAVDKAIPGDTVNVGAGIYVENISITKRLTLVGAGAGSTIVDGNRAGSVVAVVRGARVAIAGLTLRGGEASPSGGVLIDSSSILTLTDSIVTNNTSTTFGGGIYNQGTLTIANSRINDNASAAPGGGIYSTGDLTILSSAVSSNMAVNGGGINTLGITTIVSSTISGNIASGTSEFEEGGGIFNEAGMLTIVNSTISGNGSAARGGGIMNRGALTIVNSTITDNEANHGAGIDHIGSSVTLANTILAGNSAPASPDCFGGVTSQGNNLLGTNAGCGFNAVTGDLVGTPEQPIDPRLAPLRDNGGATFTHALLPGSPAIDAGSAAACPPADQRGVARSITGCEIGAYEADRPATQLIFIVEPQGGLEDESLPVQPVVAAQDAQGLGASFGSPITLSLSGGTPGAILNGTTTRDTIGGRAAFTDLSIDRGGTGYQLIASATGVISAESALIAIAIPPPPPGEDPEFEVEINDTIDQANPLLFTQDNLAVRTGVISSTDPLTVDLDVFSFAVAPGATVAISLTGLPADYDVLLLADPTVTLPISDDIDLSHVSDIGQKAIGQKAIGQKAIGQKAIGQKAIGQKAISSYFAAASDNAGTRDESILAFLPTGGTYYVIVYGASDKDFDPNRRYRLEVRLRGGALRTPTLLARPIADLNLAPDPDVRTIYLAHLDRLAVLYPDDLAASAALSATLAPDSPLLAPGAAGGKGVTIDLSRALTPSDARYLVALYNQWDGDMEQPLLANEVARQIWYALDFAITSRYPNAAYIVIVGGDEVIPFYRTPDETTLANERDYPPQLPADLRPGSALFGSLFYGFVQTDNFYADRVPTLWRGRGLYLPDLGIGRLVERPGEIARYLNGYLASGNYTIEAAGDDAAALVTGYDFLKDQAEAIVEQLEAYGFVEGADPGSAPSVRALINDTWDRQALEEAWFGGQIDRFTGVYSNTQTPYNLMVINSHFTHFDSIPAQLGGGTFFAERIFSPTAALDVEAYFKIDGAPTLIYSVGCQSGLNAPDTSFEPLAPLRLRADFAQAVLKQGGNWIGNTGFGFGDTDVVGYSERLALLFTRAIGRPVAGGPTIGDSLARAKRQYTLTIGPGGFSVYDEKVTAEMTLYGLPFIQVLVPEPVTPLDPPPLPIPASILPTLPASGGVFTRIITLTNTFRFASEPGSPEPQDRVLEVVSSVQDSFLPGQRNVLTSEPQMGLGRPVLPVLSYDVTLLENIAPPLPGSSTGIPFVQGVRLLDARALSVEQGFNPHITTVVTQETVQQGDPAPDVLRSWLPDVPFTFQRDAQYVPGRGQQFNDSLRVIPAQFRASNSQTGQLRRFSRMVFAITYVDPHTAPATVEEREEGPQFLRARISRPFRQRGHDRVRLRARVLDVSATGALTVSVTYTTDGRTWQQQRLSLQRDGVTFLATVPAPPRGGSIFAFFQAVDAHGNSATVSFNRHRPRAQAAIELDPTIADDDARLDRLDLGEDDPPDTIDREDGEETGVSP